MPDDTYNLIVRSLNMNGMDQKLFWPLVSKQFFDHHTLVSMVYIYDMNSSYFTFLFFFLGRYCINIKGNRNILRNDKRRRKKKRKVNIGYILEYTMGLTSRMKYKWGKIYLFFICYINCVYFIKYWNEKKGKLVKSKTNVKSSCFF